jgi:hypothetical protein
MCMRLSKLPSKLSPFCVGEGFFVDGVEGSRKSCPYVYYYFQNLVAQDYQHVMHIFALGA